MPERTRLSAHQLPTPPTPKRITRLLKMVFVVCLPNKSSVRLNISDSWFISFSFGCEFTSFFGFIYIICLTLSD
jgi:hypothetical protein